MLKPLLNKLKSRINNEYILLQEINKCKSSNNNDSIMSFFKDISSQAPGLENKLINEFCIAIRNEIMGINLTSIITISSNALLGLIII